MRVSFRVSSLESRVSRSINPHRSSRIPPRVLTAHSLLYDALGAAWGCARLAAAAATDSVLWDEDDAGDGGLDSFVCGVWTGGEVRGGRAGSAASDRAAVLSLVGDENQAVSRADAPRVAGTRGAG